MSITKDQPLLHAIRRILHWLPLIPMNWMSEISVFGFQHQRDAGWSPILKTK